MKFGIKKELWLRIRHYRFDHLAPPNMLEKVTAAFGGADASTKAFAHKLSRKLGWRPAFAFRAIEEYKRFVYLGVVSDSVVTPSLIIDQVWHEHLLFSRGYREFCRDVLQRDFDHNPELVPSEKQTAVFKAQFDATIDSYRAEFNVEPPPQIWGETKFDADAPSGATPRRKRNEASATADGSDAPLYLLLGSDSGGSSDGGFDFGGGGGFSGGGGGSDWGGSSDASDSGGSGDSGSSDGGGSSCSSGCGGGGD